MVIRLTANGLLTKISPWSLLLTIYFELIYYRPDRILSLDITLRRLSSFFDKFLLEQRTVYFTYQYFHYEINDIQESRLSKRHWLVVYNFWKLAKWQFLLVGLKTWSNIAHPSCDLTLMRNESYEWAIMVPPLLSKSLQICLPVLIRYPKHRIMSKIDGHISTLYAIWLKSKMTVWFDSEKGPS